MSNEAFRNPELPVDERVTDLLSRMSVEQKAGQVSQFFYFGNPEASEANADNDVHEVEQAIIDGRAGSVLFVRDVVTANRLQKLAVEQSPLGIPLLFGFDVIHGLRTVMPAPLGVAASFCPETARRGQEVAAREARAIGIHWTFAPMVDIARDPRWGRMFEGAGEDPYLGGAMAAAQVRGFQGELDEQGRLDGSHILAGPKHLAGYGAATGGRDYEDSDISDNELWNVYLPPFHAAVKAGAANIMSAYMDLNGVPASGNRWLLTEVLRNQMGFEGFVVSDANAVRSLATQHYARDLTDAAAKAVHAGLDMEMTMTDPAYSRLPQAIADGTVTAAELDQAVRRILTAKFRMGLFDQPYADADQTDAVLNAPEHRDVAREAAQKSLVLLKNDGLLPLDPSSLKKVAVIGQLADSRRDTLGPWIFDFDLAETVTVLEGLRQRLGEGVTVEHAPGACIPDRLFPSMFDDMEAEPAVTGEGYDDDAAIERAVELARGADVAIVVAGQRQNQTGERASVSSLDLPGRQLEQLQRLAETGTPVVLVLMSARPLDLRWPDEHLPAILQAWYPGCRGGEAVAAALMGDLSPAGRLPFTWVRTVGQVPMTLSHYTTFQPEYAHERYWDESSTPLYPFGHGLSYGSFEYSDLRVEPSQLGVGETATVTVTLTNTSQREADEVAQLYLHQRYGSASRPARELKGFQRVTLGAGESRELVFELGPDELRYWNAAARDWVQESSTFDVWVGGSSTADLATSFEVR
ncbi:MULTISPECIES: glycoside hydrolase family 3 N-terminal domain-containing protein [unclassified Luteococcus]|uniref:glycoside hydrolase family 3 N-terminal domain-containing protein n=1 Tax=unclassified Luteococcus TaxID=2639923 RepID=UPI00313DA7AA